MITLKRVKGDKHINHSIRTYKNLQPWTLIEGGIISRIKLSDAYSYNLITQKVKSADQEFQDPETFDLAKHFSLIDLDPSKVVFTPEKNLTDSLIRGGEGMSVKEGQCVLEFTGVDQKVLIRGIKDSGHVFYHIGNIRPPAIKNTGFMFYPVQHVSFVRTERVRNTMLCVKMEIVLEE